MTNLLDTTISLFLAVTAALFAIIGPFAIPLIAEGYVTGLGTVLLVPCLIGCPWVACHLPMIVGGR